MFENFIIVCRLALFPVSGSKYKRIFWFFLTIQRKNSRIIHCIVTPVDRNSDFYTETSPSLFSERATE